MPLPYFRSRVFDAGAVVLVVGAFAVHHGISEFRAAEAAATWHHISLPSSKGITFDAAYTKAFSVGPWLILGVLLVLAGLGALTFAARRVSRQR
jgi:hypothetical protein